jgi:hypothetical protein
MLLSCVLMTRRERKFISLCVYFYNSILINVAVLPKKSLCFNFFTQQMFRTYVHAHVCART